MRKNWMLWAAIFSVITLLVGCQQPSPSSVNTSTTSQSPVTGETEQGGETTDQATESSGYPGPSGQGDSGYPAPSTIDEEAIITRTPDPTLDPNRPVPTPEPGLSTVTGHILSTQSNEPLVNIPVSLAKVHRNEEGQGAFVFDGASSPTTLTDANGRFILANVDAAEYVLVVGNIEVNRYEILADASGKAEVWQASPDNILDIGNTQVDIEWQ